MSAPGRITAQGLSVAPPAGFEAAIYRRPPEAGAQTFGVLHAATVPLPPGRGDYGGGLVETLGAQDLFVAVLDFGPGAADTALYRSQGIPGLTPDMFRTKQLQRVLRGQAGVQRFFTEAGRAFCLYAVIGAYVNRIPLCARANQVIGSLQIESIG